MNIKKKTSFVFRNIDHVSKGKHRKRGGENCPQITNNIQHGLSVKKIFNNGLKYLLANI